MRSTRSILPLDRGKSPELRKCHSPIPFGKSGLKVYDSGSLKEMQLLSRKNDSHSLLGGSLVSMSTTIPDPTATGVSAESPEEAPSHIESAQPTSSDEVNPALTATDETQDETVPRDSGHA